MSNINSTDDILTVTYRTNQHLYPNNKIIDRSQPQAKPTVLQWFLAIFIVHYFLWFIAMFAVVYILYALGYPYIALALFVMYLPSYFRADEKKLGRPWHSLRTHRVWYPLQRYLKVECIREQKLDTNKQYCFAIHPHGILILSRPAVYGGVIELLFPGIEHRVLGASAMFQIPGCRELCLWMNATNAEKRVAENLLKSTVPKSKDNESGKLSLVVYPGGSKEIFTTDKYDPVTTLTARKGFIKLAIQNGLQLVPAFVFNEKLLYEKIRIPKPIESFFMNSLRTPLLLFYGKWYSWIPQETERGLTVVFGKVIPVQQDSNPSQETIDKYFNLYYESIKDLFNRHKKACGYADNETLHIIDEDTRKSSKKSN